MIDGRLARTFRAIAEAAPAGSDDWWIIGSAAMVLSGMAGVAPDDVDILTASRTTAHAFIAGWDAVVVDGTDHPSIRSAPFLRVFLPDCHTIEVLGRLEVAAGEIWQIILPRSRIAVAHAGGTLFVPAVEDQIEIFRLLGREKDMEKARLCEAFLAAGGAAIASA